MRAQDRRRGFGTDLTLKTLRDSFGFARVWNDTQNLFRLENLADAHRDRAHGHIGQGLEPAFAELLAAAGLIEIDHDVRFFGFKISGRIVEGQMSVLANADESYVDRGFAKLAGNFGDSLGWVLLAVEKMMMRNADFVDQPIQ